MCATNEAKHEIATIIEKEASLVKQKECNLVIMEKASNTPRQIPEGMSAVTRNSEGCGNTDLWCNEDQRICGQN